MKRPTLAEVGQFTLIVFGVLFIAKMVRILLFDGLLEALGAFDIIVAIAAAVIVTGGWLRRSDADS